VQFEPEARGGDDEIEHAVEIEVQGGDRLAESLVGGVAVKGPHHRSAGISSMARGCCGQIDRVVALCHRLSAKHHEGRPHLRPVAMQRGIARCCSMPQQCQCLQRAGLVGQVDVPPTTKSSRPSPSKSAVAKLVMKKTKKHKKS
jgi:hypothetical protein